MTLIQVGNSQGVIGRCDAKCYGAKHPHCDCVCCGKNHGAGLAAAAANTRELGEAWLTEFSRRHPGALTGTIADFIRQPDLFQ